MALDLTRNSKNGTVPCLPCCNYGYQSCACPTNERLNVIGGKNANGDNLNKSSPSNLVPFFIKDLFAGESSVANRFDRTDAVNQDGMLASSVSCYGALWTFLFPSTPKTLQAFVRFLDDIFEGKLIIDGVDSGWVSLEKTFANEFITTLQGEISGYQIISHSICVCRGDVTSPAYAYPPYMKETEKGVKPLFVTFEGLPAICGTNFELNKNYEQTPYPLRTQEDLKLYHSYFPVTGSGSARIGAEYENGPSWQLYFKLVFQSGVTTPLCSGKFLDISFSWVTDQYIIPINYVLPNIEVFGNKEAATGVALTITPNGNPAGTSNWEDKYLFTILPSLFLIAFPDFSFPIKLDLEPFYYEYTAYGYDRTQDDYNLLIKRNHSVYDGEVISPKVIITE